MTFNSTEQNIGWFRDIYLRDSLEIKPPFQRKPVWAERQKCYLIETILLGLPVPEIYIQQITSEDGTIKYAVVDGQQRIRTVLQFVGFEKDEEEQEHNKFKLDKLQTGSHYAGKGFADLTPEDKKTFYGYRFVVRYLNTTDDGSIRDMFKRLNKFLTPLRPQELRNATFMGPFARLSEKLADNPYWAENSIVTAAAIRRMGDVEFVSELLIGVLHGPQGGGASLIDQYYTQYEDFEDEFPGQKKASKTFEETLELIKKLLPEIKSSRWSNKTDFYSLFIALASAKDFTDLEKNTQKIQKEIIDFGNDVDDAQAGEAKPAYIQTYNTAIEKGANDKARQATRHEILVKRFAGAATRAFA